MTMRSTARPGINVATRHERHELHELHERCGAGADAAPLARILPGADVPGAGTSGGQAPNAFRRRDGLRAATAAATLLLLGTGPSPARAGAQKEEPLIDSVRTALSAAIASGAPPKPQFSNTDERLAYLRWLGACSERLKRRKSEAHTRIEFLETLWYEAKRAGLEPALVLGLVQVESGFRKYAISSAGARGYMQVMPFWTRVIGDGDAAKLFHMQTNLRFGCVILRHYLEIERGDLFFALGRYNGSRGKAEYPNLVFGARRQWQV